MPMAAPDFEQLFVDGARHTVRGLGDVTIRLRPVGELSLPSGRIIAGEPFFFHAGGYEDGFVQQVPPGRYPVVLVLADYGAPGDDEHSMIVAARLVIRDEPVVSWELALRPGQDVGTLDDDEFFGYPVDGGTSGFADVQSVEALGADYDDYSERLMDALDDRGVDAGFLTEGSEQILVVFSSGDGDGYYPTWVGRTAAGEVACLLNDFFIVPDDDDDEDEEAPTPPAASAPSRPIPSTNKVSASRPLTPVSAPLAQRATAATRAVPAKPLRPATPARTAATPARPTMPARPVSPPPDAD